MKIKIEKNYLIFPTCSVAKRKRVRFLDGDKEVYALNVRLDKQEPDFYAYIDVRRFIGKELEMEVRPEMCVDVSQENEMDGEYNDCLRPYIHFTTKRGWINDPNGLIKVGDEYHLFYQHNPAERMWGNMHWGHAVSKDLFHWKERQTVLFPDETGTMFSGAAVIDEKNVSKLGKQGETPILIYYTAAGAHATVPVPFTQCLAYSTDGLQTIKKYDKNPLIGHMVDLNRDPKVVWCEELNAYVMALFLVDNEFSLLRSDDLMHWEEFQRLVIAGEYECPNFYPLVASNGKRKWVFTGARDVYAIGDFVDGKFKPSQDVKRMNDTTTWYAAQCFTDMPDGRTIRMPWLRTRAGKTFAQAIGMPCEVSLQLEEGEYYLAFHPVAELLAIENAREEYANVNLEKGTKIELADCATGVRLQGEWKETGKIQLMYFGVEITLDFSKNEIVVGDQVNKLSRGKNCLDVQIIADRAAMEFFCDKGKIAFAVSEQAISDGNLPWVEISCDCAYELEKLTVTKYACTWEK